MRWFYRPVCAGCRREGASGPYVRAGAAVHEEHRAGALCLGSQSFAKAIGVLRGNETIELALRIIGGRLPLEDHHNGAFDAASPIIIPVQVGRGNAEAPKQDAATRFGVGAEDKR